MDDRTKINKCLMRLKRGERCFDELVRVSIGYVGFVVHKSLTDKSFLQEAIDSAYMSAVKYIQSVDGGKNAFAWLCTVARNEAYKINERERRRRSSEIELDAAETQAADAENVDDDARLGIMDLYNALDRLDELDKTVIECIYLEGLGYKEIAARLGISVSDVHYRKKRALKKLLEFLSD